MPMPIPPKPDRLPPFVLGPHEVTPELDVDWTLCPEDWDMEVRLRYERILLIKEKLLAGETVCYRSSGSSLKPRVKSGDQCTFIPVTKESQVEVNDIVFCEVQPRDRFYGHVVKKKEFWWSSCCYYFTISNLRGRENGWCKMEHIYGKLIEDDWCKMEHMVQDGEE